jgi:hypothetical protein
LAAVVGQKAASDSELMATIIKSLLYESPPERLGDFNRRNLIAIQEAINGGGGNLVASHLLEIPIDTLAPNRIPPLSLLLKHLSEPVDGTSQMKPSPHPPGIQVSSDGSSLLMHRHEPSTMNHEQDSFHPQETVPRLPPLVNPELKLALAQWVAPIVPQHPVELIRAIDALASNSPSVQQQLGQLLEQLLPNLPPNQANPIIKKLSHIPEQLEPYLQQTTKSKESRSVLLKIYQHQAGNGSSSAISNILKLCADESRDVALAASWIILTLAEQQKKLNVSELLPVLAQSKFVGVRQNCLKALILAINSGFVVTESEIIAVFDALANETAAEVVLLLYKLVECLIWNHPSGSLFISPTVAQATFDLTRKLVNEKSQISCYAFKL